MKIEPIKACWHKDLSMCFKGILALGCLGLSLLSLAAAAEEQTPLLPGWGKVRSVKMSGVCGLSGTSVERPGIRQKQSNTASTR